MLEAGKARLSGYGSPTTNNPEPGYWLVLVFSDYSFTMNWFRKRRPPGNQ